MFWLILKILSDAGRMRLIPLNYLRKAHSERNISLVSKFSVYYWDKTSQFSYTWPFKYSNDKIIYCIEAAAELLHTSTPFFIVFRLLRKEQFRRIAHDKHNDFQKSFYRENSWCLPEIAAWGLLRTIRILLKNLCKEKTRLRQ